MRLHFHHILMILLVVALLAPANAGLAFSDESAVVLLSANNPILSSEKAHADNAFVLRRRAAFVNAPALVRSRSLSRVQLNLFDDAGYLAFARSQRTDRRGSLLWTGVIPEVENGKVILIVNGENVTGAVFVGDRVYQIRSLGSNLHLVREVRKIDSSDREQAPSYLSPEERKVIELVNKERVIEGLAPLQYNSRLGAAARSYALDMAVTNHFDHTRRDGRKFHERIFDAGYPVSRCGENLAVGFTAPEEAFEGWISSPGHKSNILNGGFTEIGVGHAVGGKGESRVQHHYWAQSFGGARRHEKSLSIESASRPFSLSLSQLLPGRFMR